MAISAEATKSVTEGERRAVTALFADIKDLMELMESLDPEESRVIADPALKLMINAVCRHDGYVVQSTGDGAFGLFDVSVAHEDHSQRALYAALCIQEDVRRHGDRMPAKGQPPLQMRHALDLAREGHGEILAAMGEAVKQHQVTKEAAPVERSVAVSLMAYLVLLRTQDIGPGQPWGTFALKHHFVWQVSAQHFRPCVQQQARREIKLRPAA